MTGIVFKKRKSCFSYPWYSQPSSVPDAWKELVQLSQRTNELQRKLQQAQCNEGAYETDTGSWCRLAVENGHRIDYPLAAALSELLAGKSVLSLGDGRGEYRALLLNSSTPVRRSLVSPASTACSRCAQIRIQT